MKTLYLYLFILFLLAVAFFIGRPGFREVRLGWESKSWETTVGRVEKAEISSKEDADSEIIYSFNLLFSYEVEGQPYQNTRVRPRAIRKQNMHFMSDWLEKYPEGSEVEVFYNPENHAESMLEPGIVAGSWVSMGFGCVVGLFAVILIFYDVKERFF